MNSEHQKLKKSKQEGCFFSSLSIIQKEKKLKKQQLYQEQEDKTEVWPDELGKLIEHKHMEPLVEDVALTIVL